MAVWQHEIRIEPGNADIVEQLGEPTEFAVSDADIIAMIDAWLPREKSWDPNVVCWGKGIGNRLHVTNESGRIAEIAVRVDLRNSAIEFMSGLVEFVKRIGGRIVNLDGEAIELRLSSVLAELSASSAAKFVRDPERFLAASTNSEQVAAS